MVLSSLTIRAEQVVDSSDIYIRAIKDNPDDFKARKALYAFYMRTGDYDKALRCASSILDISTEAGDRSRELQADSYMGQAYLAINKVDSAYVFLTGALKSGIRRPKWTEPGMIMRRSIRFSMR